MAARPIRIRQAAPQDAPSLIAILHDTFQSTWRPQISDTAAAAFLAEDRPAAYVRECVLEFRIAERGGVVAGFVHWRDDFVHALHVASADARSGIGSALMDVAEAAIAAAGFKAARLETDTFNARSRAFYARRGYVEAERYPDEEWNSGLETLLLVKTLS